MGRLFKKKEERERLRRRRRARRKGEDLPDDGSVITVGDLPKTVKKPRRRKRRFFSKGRGFRWRDVVLLCLIVPAAFLTAWGLARLNGEAFRISRHWPILLSTGVFLLSTLGYFSAPMAEERIYGIFSVLAAVCLAAEVILMYG